MKLAAAIIAAAFAATSLGAIAQSKDVTDKKGGTVKSKDGKAVATKEMKDKPKAEPKTSTPKAAPAPKPKEKGADVKTKSGGTVSSKDGKDVTGKSK
jgi:hypothetical protein